MSKKIYLCTNNFYTLLGTVSNFSSGVGCWVTPERGAAFYNANWESKGAITINKLQKIIQ